MVALVAAFVASTNGTVVARRVANELAVGTLGLYRKKVLDREGGSDCDRGGKVKATVGVVVVVVDRRWGVRGYSGRGCDRCRGCCGPCYE
jgi:hypothetical protein